MKIEVEELKKKLETVEQPFDPPLEVWQQFAPSFATVVMRGAMDAVLQLDDEAKNMVLKEAGAAWSDLLQSHEIIGQPEELPADQVAKATMSGAFKGIRKLDEESKKFVLKKMGETCFRTMMAAYASWEAAGIPFSEGSYDVDGVNILLENILSSRRIWKEGDVVFYESKVADRWEKCACSLYHAGITEPVPELCQCATLTMETQYEHFTGMPWEAEFIESITTGSGGSCLWKMHLKAKP